MLAAYYCPEPLSARAERAILRCDSPAISPLVSVELHSAVARKRREGHLSEPDARRIVAQFRLHLDDGCYSVLPLEVVHFDLARDWLGQFSVPLRTLDALHLAVCGRAEAELLTADRELFTAARSFGMRARLLA